MLGLGGSRLSTSTIPPHRFTALGIRHGKGLLCGLQTQRTEARTVDGQQGSNEQDGQQHLGLHFVYLQRTDGTDHSKTYCPPQEVCKVTVATMIGVHGPFLLRSAV